MTENFKVGEHVKIVLSDEGYNSELGDQKGLVGTVAEVSNSSGVYVTFPHTGDAKFYYVPVEFVRAPGTTPTPEPLKVGDWVEVEGYNSTWNGTVGRIDSFSSSGVNANIKKKPEDLYPLTFPKTNLVVTEEPKPVFKVGDRVEFTEQYSSFDTGDAGTVTGLDDEEDGDIALFNITLDDGRKTSAFAKRFKHTTKQPIPKAKFGVGDWVRVTGYTPYGTSTNWEGVKGKVIMVGDYSAYDKTYSYVIETAGGKPYLTGGFDENYLKHTVAPVVHKFKVGDWVEVTGCCTMPTCNGTVWQVEAQRGEASPYYELKSEKGNTSNYSERNLKAASKPEHKFKVGEWVEVTGWGSGQNGTKLQVKAVPVNVGGYYKFEGKDSGYGFTERYLQATTVPHWTESEPIHSAIRIGGRTIVKIAEDKWLFLYHDGSYSEEIGSMTTRNNEDTRNALGGDRPRYAFTTPS